MVSGPVNLVGGLAGYMTSGSVTNGYWDTETSGRNNAFGYQPGGTVTGVQGLTTTQLQAGLPAGFVGASFGGVWNQITGQSFPYFNWQFAGPSPDVISGTAYVSPGGYVLAGAGVGGLENGTYLGSATTGANGYYQILIARGTLRNADVLTYLTGAHSGNSIATGVSGSVTGLNLYENVLYARTSDTSLSALGGDVVQAGGAYEGTNPSVYDVNGGNLPANTNVWINASGSFLIDNELGTDGGIRVDAARNLTIANSLHSPNTVILNAGGNLTETGSGTITANTLKGSANGWVGLNGANAINILQRFTNTGSNGFGLNDTVALTVNGALNAGSGALSIHDNASLTFNAPVTAGANASIQVQGAINLNSALTTGGALQMYAFGGAITEGTGGVITAPTFSGGGQGLYAPNANAIGTLAGFGRTGTSDPITFNDTLPLSVTGAVSAGVGSIVITAPSLTVGASMVATGDITLTAKSDLTLNALVSATGNERLTAQTGAISEGASGVAWAVGLTTLSGGTTTLNGANHVSQLLGATANGFSLNDTVRLEVDGTVNAGAGNLAFSGTTTGGFYFNAAMTAGGTGSFSTPGGIFFNNSLVLGGAMSVNTTVYGVTEGAGGAITATSLSGNAAGGAYLAGANQIGILAGFTTGGNFTLVDNHALQVTGAVTAAGVITLTDTANADLTIGAAISSPSKVTLTTGGSVTEVSGGKVSADTINVKADSGINLGGANTIAHVGVDITNTGPNVINR